MDFAYAIAPFVSWTMAGSIKFLINSIKSKQLAFHQIGYGGLPSNHSAIVSSAAALIAIREGIDHPAFGVAIALGFVVLLDATSLRKQVGRQAEAINRLTQQGSAQLRERMGHTPVEIFAGIGVGTFCAFMVDIAFKTA